METIAKVENVNNSLVIDDKKRKSVSRHYLSDEGELQLDNMPSERKKYYYDIAKCLNENDLTSVASYGSDLQNAMNTYSSDFLKQSFDSNSGIDSALLISKLLYGRKWLGVSRF